MANLNLNHYFPVNCVLVINYSQDSVKREQILHDSVAHLVS